MAKDIERVVRKYEVKLRSGRAPCRLDGDMAAQVENYRAMITTYDNLRRAVVDVLNSQGVLTIWWAAYFAFARKLLSLAMRQPSSGYMQAETEVQVAKSTADGLSRKVLVLIALTVFNVEVPAEPVAAAAGQV